MKLTAYQRRQVDYVKANMPGMVTRQHKGMSRCIGPRGLITVEDPPQTPGIS